MSECILLGETISGFVTGSKNNCAPVTREWTINLVHTCSYSTPDKVVLFKKLFGDRSFIRKNHSIQNKLVHWEWCASIFGAHSENNIYLWVIWFLGLMVHLLQISAPYHWCIRIYSACRLTWTQPKYSSSALTKHLVLH